MLIEGETPSMQLGYTIHPGVKLSGCGCLGVTFGKLIGFLSCTLMESSTYSLGSIRRGRASVSISPGTYLLNRYTVSIIVALMLSLPWCLGNPVWLLLFIRNSSTEELLLLGRDESPGLGRRCCCRSQKELLLNSSPGFRSYTF